MSEAGRGAGVPWRAWLQVAIGLGFLGAFRTAVSNLDLERMHLGSLNFPVPGQGYTMMLWAVLGSAAVAFLALGVAKLLPERLGVTDLSHTPSEGVPGSEDTRWMLFCYVAVLILVPVTRGLVMNDVRITDDEAAYLFAARTLASGSLTAPLPPGHHLFWDQPFFIQGDSGWYTQYFLGWPALLAPGVLVGLDGFTNTIYFALTLLLAYDATRRLAGRTVARVTSLLMLASPLSVFAAATMMAHTSATTAYALCLWAWARTRQDDRAPHHDGLLAAAFCLGVFIRPLTTLALSGPLVVSWAWGLRERDRSQRLRHLAAFVPVACLGAGLFFWVNAALTGSALRTGYQASLDYAEANGFRFSAFSSNTKLGGALDFRLSRIIEHNIAKLVRLNFDGFGWPSTFLLLPFAPFAGRLRVVWAAAICLPIAHLAQGNAGGVDTYGPPKLVELMLPLSILTAAGAVGLAARLRSLSVGGHAPPWAERFPWALLGALVLTTTFGYTAVRVRALAFLTSNIATSHRYVMENIEVPALVFHDGPIAHNCAQGPTKHYVFAGPGSGPDVPSAPVLWVNHLTLGDDRALVREHFPGRHAYLLRWSVSCRPSVVPLAELPASRPGKDTSVVGD